MIGHPKHSRGHSSTVNSEQRTKRSKENYQTKPMSRTTHGESMGYSGLPIPRNSRLGKTRRIAPAGYKAPSPECGRPPRNSHGATTVGGRGTTERQNYQTNPIYNNQHRFSTLRAISKMPGAGGVPFASTPAATAAHHVPRKKALSLKRIGRLYQIFRDGCFYHGLLGRNPDPLRSPGTQRSGLNSCLLPYRRWLTPVGARDKPELGSLACLAFALCRAVSRKRHSGYEDRANPVCCPTTRRGGRLCTPCYHHGSGSARSVPRRRSRSLLRVLSPRPPSHPEAGRGRDLLRAPELGYNVPIRPRSAAELFLAERPPLARSPCIDSLD